MIDICIGIFFFFIFLHMLMLMLMHMYTFSFTSLLLPSNKSIIVFVVFDEDMICSPKKTEENEDLKDSEHLQHLLKCNLCSFVSLGNSCDGFAFLCVFIGGKKVVSECMPEEAKMSTNIECYFNSIE